MSQNGTRVNGVLVGGRQAAAAGVAPRVDLSDGDLIDIGGILLVFEEASDVSVA